MTDGPTTQRKVGSRQGSARQSPVSRWRVTAVNSRILDEVGIVLHRTSAGET